jgi:hypothetical protein
MIRAASPSVTTPAGEDIAAQLIAERLALPYDGGSRPNWCRFLADGS